RSRVRTWVAPSGVLNVRVPTYQPMPDYLPPGAVIVSSSAGVQVTHSTVRWWRPKRSWGTFLSGVGTPMVTPKESCHAGRPLLPFSL
ncbi:hypothetical protein TorRG33x02_204900, partial [Trema orientale]